MNVEVINTGTELLLGAVTNTHLTYFAHQLFPLGMRITRQVTVPDGDAIREAILDAAKQADVILITGGLGPTTDDLTRDITAEVLGLSLKVDPTVLAAITKRFADRDLVMTGRNARQAEVPTGGVVLPNTHGTAPGLYIECPPETLGTRGPLHFFLLPGPPRELYPMFEQQVTPMLRRLLPVGATHECHTYHLLGMGESNVEAAVGADLLALPSLELGYCARPGEVDLRCVGPAATLAAAEAIIQEKLAPYIASRDGVKLEEAVFNLLKERHETISTAESCTGGLISHRITNVPGSSEVFMAGYATYSNAAKTRDLGVPAALIEEHGAVSSEVAAAMAEGAIQRTGTDWALAVTGLAGPGGETPTKPVGTVYIALAHKGTAARVEKHQFSSRDRETIKTLSSHAALNLLRRALVG